MTEDVMASVDRELTSWPGVSTDAGRFNSTTYRFGKKELGHVHRNGVADLPFPRAVYEDLLATGRAQPHHAGVRGMVSFRIAEPRDVSEAVALFRLNYDRAAAEGSARAAADE